MAGNNSAIRVSHARGVRGSHTTLPGSHVIRTSGTPAASPSGSTATSSGVGSFAVAATARAAVSCAGGGAGEGRGLWAGGLGFFRLAVGRYVAAQREPGRRFVGQIEPVRGR